MPQRRTKSIGTKVTPEEYARLESLAGGQTISEWARAVLLKSAEPPTASLVLAELLALRAILLTLHFRLCAGEPITAEGLQRLIDRADRDKVDEARARLATPERRHV